MSVMLGATLGVGLLLVVSPLLWPSPRGGEATPPTRRRSALADELALAGVPGAPIPAVLAVTLVLAVVGAAVGQAASA
ncbi:hypothetical protein [Agromyces indicus]|uniref:Uncharacterized protein n=1 Tax=Agromyces indicus TaxID=758919 RepID=A0ABU1FKJ2_9MICO|nr:hypothetical protein [Agromyces indicus]MDR5691916.1 hypothetical protein [Agromyces indicus]